MADEPQKVIVQSSRLDDHILPPNFSLAYRLYVIQQGADLKGIADASNSANDLAYQATVKNQQQDVTLSDHSVRITLAESQLVNHEGRITNAEGVIVSLGGRIGVAESDIDFILGDYVSKTATDTQSLSSPLSVSSSYSVGGVKVVGARVTGFTAASGTGLKGGFAADNSYTIGTTYSQSQVQALANGLREARQRIKALEDAMRSHGLIN